MSRKAMIYVWGVSAVVALVLLIIYARGPSRRC
jgi:hypothetical protein